MRPNRDWKGSGAVDTRFAPWLSQRSSLWTILWICRQNNQGKILLWRSKIRFVDMRTAGQWFNFSNPQNPEEKKLTGFVWILLGSLGSSCILRHNTYHQSQRVPGKGVRCNWHMGRGSRAYLDPCALEGRNRVPPSLSCTNHAKLFRRFFFRICRQKLWNMVTLEYGESGVFTWEGSKNAYYRIPMR